MGKEIKDLRIKYRTGVVYKDKLEDGEKYKEYSYDYVNASISGVKRFRSAVMLLMGISGCEHHLIEWLSDNMTDGNYVQNNDLTRQSFIAFHSKYMRKGNKPYSDHAVIKAFKNLAQHELLIPIVRGTYMVNPLYYSGKNEEDRVKSIKYIMEFRSGFDTKIKVEVNK